jgi:hypothetical protein
VDAAPVDYADKPVHTPSSKKSVDLSTKEGKGKGGSKSKKGSKGGTFSFLSQRSLVRRMDCMITSQTVTTILATRL